MPLVRSRHRRRVPQRASQPVFALRDTYRHREQGGFLEQPEADPEERCPVDQQRAPDGRATISSAVASGPGGIEGVGRGDRRNAPPTDQRLTILTTRSAPAAENTPDPEATARDRKVTITPAAVVVAAETRKTCRREPRPRPAKEPVVLSAPPCPGVGTLRRSKIAEIPKKCNGLGQENGSVDRNAQRVRAPARYRR